MLSTSHTGLIGQVFALIWISFDSYRAARLFFRSSTKWAYNYVEQQQKINCENRNNSQLSETKRNFTRLGSALSLSLSLSALPHIHDVILSDVFTRDILIICVSLVQPLFIFVVLRDITFAPNSFQAQILVLQPPSVVLCCAQ